MRINFERANKSKEWRALQTIDREAYPKDFWDREDYMEKGLTIFKVTRRGKMIAWIGISRNQRFPIHRWQRWKTPGFLYIAGFCILPQFDTEQLKNQMILWLANYCEQWGMQWISTNERASHPLVPFFKKLGFSEVARQDGYWMKPPEPNVVLEREIYNRH